MRTQEDFAGYCIARDETTHGPAISRQHLSGRRSPAYRQSPTLSSHSRQAQGMDPVLPVEPTQTQHWQSGLGPPRDGLVIAPFRQIPKRFEAAASTSRSPASPRDPSVSKQPFARVFVQLR